MKKDHRQDNEIAKFNNENLNLDFNKIKFNRVQSVSSEKYEGLVYDLSIENDKNYQTEFGIVHNGGKRKGAAAVYLETHHPDIMEFLEMKDNTGDAEKRGHNLNYAVWVSDLFMERVLKNEKWSLFCPSIVPELNDIFGDEYEKVYLKSEEEELFSSQLPARVVYARIMRSLAETGNHWMCFKDISNNRCNTSVKTEEISIEVELKNGKVIEFDYNELVFLENGIMKPAHMLEKNDDIDEDRY